MKCQFAKCAKTGIIIVSSIISPLIIADELTLEPRVIAGIMNYNYQESRYDNTMTDEMPFLGIGATLAHERWFVDAYFQKSSTGEDPNILKTEARMRDFNRYDYAITLGYVVSKRLSVFTGYKYGKTNIDLIYQYQGGSPNNIVDANFKTKGLFLGAGYGLQIGNGLLAVNFALAPRLQGEENFDVKNKQALLYQESASGDALGWTLGVSWKAPITKHFAYSISLDGYKYSFDVDEAHNRSYTENGVIETDMTHGYGTLEENVLSAKVNFIYRF